MKALPRTLLAATALAIGFVLPGAVDPTSAQTPSYTAIASADSVRSTINTPGAPLSESIVDGGGPRAQASSGGIDGNIGYAAAPDPGTFLVGLPSALRGLAGIDLPNYPFVATSQYPTTPETVAEAPGVRITSTSTSSRTDATVTLGTADGQIDATAGAGSSDDGIEASAEVVISDLSIGPLRIGTVRSAVRLRRGDDGELQRQSEFTVSSADIAGIPVRIGADGIDLGPSAALPLVDLSPVGELLTTAGITVTVLPATSTESTESTAALMITAPLPAAFTTPGEYTLVLGRSTATLAIVELVPRPTTASTTSTTVGTQPGPTPPAVPSGGASGSTPAPASRPPTSAGPVAATGEAALIAGQVDPPPIRWPLRNIYFAVLAAGTLVSAGGGALRRMGVRP